MDNFVKKFMDKFADKKVYCMENLLNHKIVWLAQLG